MTHADNETQFIENVRLHRGTRGWSQEQLAQRLTAAGYPFRQQTVLKVENGQRPLRLGEAIALSALFGVSIDVLSGMREETHDDDLARQIFVRQCELAEVLRGVADELADES